MEKLQAYNNTHNKKYSIDVFRQKALDLAGRETVFISFPLPYRAN